MLHSISWQQYLLTVSALLVLYYLIIGFRYFKWELLNVIGIKEIESSLINPATGESFNGNSYNLQGESFKSDAVTENNPSLLLKSFEDEIKAFLNEARYSKVGKEDIYDSIKIIFSKYPSGSLEEFNNNRRTTFLEEINEIYPGFFELQDFNKLFRG